MHPAPIDDPRNHLAHIITGARVTRNDPVQLTRIVQRRLRFTPFPRRRTTRTQVRHDRAHDRQGVEIIFRQVVGDAGDVGMDHCATEFLGADLLACRRLDQRRTAEKDRTGATHDHHFVAHRRHIRTASGARPHNCGDLRDAFGGHTRLIVENPPEVIAVGEDLCLKRQEGAAAIDKIDAGEIILLSDLLSAQMLFDRQRIVRTALHRRIVGDDHHLAPGDAPDAGDDTGGRNRLIIDLVRCQRPNFEKGGRRVEQAFNPFAHKQLAARCMALTRLQGTASARLRQPGAQIIEQHGIRFRISAEGCRARINKRFNRGHCSIRRAQRRCAGNERSLPAARY